MVFILFSTAHAVGGGIMVGMKVLEKERDAHPFVVFHEAEEGGYRVEIPAMPGCFSDGNTLDEARHNILEAAQGWLKATLDVELSARARRGVAPSAHRAHAVPPVVEFDVCGRHFVADVVADGDSYSATVRGRDDCCTCGDTETEIRRNLVEVVELAVFGIADRVYA